MWCECVGLTVGVKFRDQKFESSITRLLNFLLMFQKNAQRPNIEQIISMHTSCFSDRLYRPKKFNHYFGKWITTDSRLMLFRPTIPIEKIQSLFWQVNNDWFSAWWDQPECIRSNRNSVAKYQPKYQSQFSW